MAKFPTATREDHDTFCTTEGWELVRGAAGKPVRHHRTYKLPLGDGRILRTRISKPVDRTDYPAFTWVTILREQLEVTNSEFWACVRDSVLPQRATRMPDRPGIPYYLYQVLTDHVGMPPDEVARLTVDEAQERVAAFWSRSRDPE
ncbi:hypothetical protein SAMN04489806_1393 [Paramicrobacterium humi]|uniref:Cytotoxic translational repressor of toxin-antitoxin stability system n=2 Tax=Paramicrobacterium humi TaxID=640635 RepID=A0A1H4L2N0_9MICO|nr:hypothetical protein SAMN04489806_1393 [Microbacterium humi]